MSKPFKGTINVDIRDSVPDWAPFEPPKAPDGAPNVVYIVLDDVGFSAMDCYGGPIETPNIDPIAASVMHAMLLRVWLRPVSRHDRVGEHSAVVCHCV